MTHKELLYIKTIAEEKSISKAAKKLYISQPSLSQAVQRIEETLGTFLFKRTNNGLLLTLSGEKYYQMAITILKVYDNFQMEISDINNMKTGRINIGITTHLGTYVLPLVIPEFKKLCPFIDIYIIEKNSTELEKSLLSGEVDFAIMHQPKKLNCSQISYFPLVEDPFLLAMSPNHPLTKYGQINPDYEYPKIDFKLVCNEPFIMLNKEQRIRHVSDKIFENSKIEPIITLTVKNFETARRLSAQGVGLTFIPLQYSKISASEFPPAYFFIDDKYEANWTMCIATMKNVFLSKADTLFLQIIKSNFNNSI
jgi:DNA-binding transcriptional LysR family regulator